MTAPANPSLITSPNAYLFGPFAKYTAQLEIEGILVELFDAQDVEGASVVFIDADRDWPSTQPSVAVVAGSVGAATSPEWYRGCGHLIRLATHPAGQFGPVSFSALAVGDVTDRQANDDRMLAFASATDLHRFVAAVRRQGVTVLDRPPLAGLGSAVEEVASEAEPDLPDASTPAGLAKRLVRWYTAPSGLLLAAALLLIGYAILGLWLARIVGLIGLALVALFLPYRFERQERRAIRLTKQNQHRIARLENRRR